MNDHLLAYLAAIATAGIVYVLGRIISAAFTLASYSEVNQPPDNLAEFAGFVGDPGAREIINHGVGE